MPPKIPIGIIFYSSLLFAFINTGYAQSAGADTAYDLLLRRARVYDPRSGMQGRYDIAIRSGLIVRIAKKIESSSAQKVLDARGLRAVPGFIDIHTHVFSGSLPGTFANGTSSVNPDQYCPMNGITTVVDAGTSGFKNFEAFLSQIITPSRTRVFAFLNIAGAGMSGKPLEEDTAGMNWSSVKELVRKHSDRIVGFKVGHFNQGGELPMQRARQMADSASLPVFVECHLPQIPLEVQLSYLKSGDMITHCFEQVEERQPFVQKDGTIIESVLKARDRGVLFDLGHGGAGFWFDQSVPALQQGFLPNTFGTDLHRNSMSSSMKSLPNVLSKFLALGVPFNEVIARCTWNAAQAIHHPELGQIAVGGIADITLLRLERGKFGFVDAAGKRIQGKRRIAVELTIRDGKVIWDLQGRASRDWEVR